MQFFSPLEQFDSIYIGSVFIHEFGFYGFLFPLFNNTILPAVLIFFFFSFFYSELLYDEVSLIPSFWQLFFEKLYFFVFNILDQQVGSKGYIYFPLIFSIFLFIFLCNLISMTPFGIALTSHIILILLLSLTLGLSIFFIGLLTHNITFLKLFIPECPFVLMPFLIFIEIFSYIIRCFSLAIRLSANIIAGHTLVYIISNFILYTVSIKFWLFFFFIFLIGAILLLEIGIACLQAYVFTILVCIYLNDSLKAPGH